MADTTLHTPPQKSWSLPPVAPDTVLANRHTSQADYRTGDLKLGRMAVLADLGRYLRVPFDRLMACVGATTPEDVQKTLEKLKGDDNILIHGESGFRWRGFTVRPSKSQANEENTFRPLCDVFNKILENVPDCGVSFEANPTKTPLSDRKNTSRPDGCLLRTRNRVDSTGIHWFDIAVPFEFKKNLDPKAMQDNEQKIIWSLHNIMREDPCRRYAFGITIEDTQLRLWLSNRAVLAASKPIDFIQEVDHVISLFHALGSASAPTAQEGLGWDPTITRMCNDGSTFQYKFIIDGEEFTTTRALSTYGADSMVGRATRVYEAVSSEGRKVAIKDSWRDTDRDSEGVIMEKILSSCRERLSVEEAADMEKRIVRMRLCEDVKISGVLDKTANLMVGANGVSEDVGFSSKPDPTRSTADGNYTFEWVEINLKTILAEESQRHLSSTGNIPDNGAPSTLLPTQLNHDQRATRPPCRIHVRTVSDDVGVALQDVRDLSKFLHCLRDALKALYLLHKAGWVHRDFSVGNVIWISDIGKLGDFEYAKQVDSEVSHDVRTGTLHFMSVEVEKQRYAFIPDRIPREKPPFRMNFLHDIESAWWTFAWAMFYYTDKGCLPTDPATQHREFQKAFPNVIGSITCLDFFINAGELQTACDTLSSTCKRVCGSLESFAVDLRISYRRAEKSYPMIIIDKQLLKDIHEQAFSHLTDALAQADEIEFIPICKVVGNKRPRREWEGSPTRSSGTKKACRG